MADSFKLLLNAGIARKGSLCMNPESLNPQPWRLHGFSRKDSTYSHPTTLKPITCYSGVKITNTTLGVPYYNYSIMGPKTLF